MRTLAAEPEYSAAEDTTTLRLTEGLSFRHFAGEALPGEDLRLRAPVALAGFVGVNVVWRVSAHRILHRVWKTPVQAV